MDADSDFSERTKQPLFGVGDSPPRKDTASLAEDMPCTPTHVRQKIRSFANDGKRYRSMPYVAVGR